MQKSRKTDTRLGILATLFVLGLVTALILLPNTFQSEANSGKSLRGPIPPVDQDAEPIFDIREGKSEEQSRALQKFRESLSKDASLVADARDKFVRGEEAFRAQNPNTKIEYNTGIRSPEVISPDFSRIRYEFLTAPSAAKRSEILRSFLKQYSDLAGVDTDQADQLKVAADYTNPDGNISYAHLEQLINGVPVFNGEVKAGFTKDGRIIRVINNLAPGLDYNSLSNNFGDPANAVHAALRHIGRDSSSAASDYNPKESTDLKAVFGTGDWATTAEKMYFPTEPGVAVPAWRVLSWGPGFPYYVIVDAQDGIMLWKKNIQDHQTQSATYQVYGNTNAYIDVADSPAPLSPSPNNPTLGTQGAMISRTSRTLVGNEGDLSFNNNGWITDGTNVTDGNAVEAGIDRVSPNGNDFIINGAPNRTFTSTWNPPPGNPAPGDEPLTEQAQRGAVIQMFYVMNRYHDELYKLGFTEAARNFQHSNFGRGGAEADRVSAEGQDNFGTSCTSNCFNNANFATPADGGRGRMQMYLWNGPTPDYDGTTDADVIIHEITHGTSNRLHGNGSGLGNQGAMMGEGWGDWYAHTMLAEPSDDVNGIYSLGGYATYLATSGFTSNYYYGIRRFPKVTIATVGPNGKPHNPFTFRYLNTGCDTLIGTPTSNPPPNSAYPRGPFGTTGACSQVHNAGEIWSSTLWEVRALLVQRLGFTNGTRTALQIVTDGMKLAPINPMMLQERDAILAAAAALPSGSSAAVADVWEGFRRRGMGFSASTQSSSAVTEAFDLPNAVIAPTGFSVSDAPGDNDGFPEPGETVLLNIPVTNNTGATVTNVSVSVAGGGTVNYGSVNDGQTVTQAVPYTVPAGAACGSDHAVSITLTSTIGTQPAVTRSFRLGAPVGGAPVTVTNNTPTTIPASGAATPYPSTVNVSGVTGQKKIKVTLDLTHTFPGDVDALLVGPGGQKYIFMSDAGASFSSSMTNGILEIFDDAPAVMPTAAGLVTGQWRPTNYGANDAFVAPAPAGPYANAPTGGTDTFASVFGGDGSAMNGTWSLYIVDDAAGDQGVLNSWSITFEPNEFTCSTNPPASNFDVGGRVTSGSGSGVANAVVRLVNGGTTLVARTNAFGYYNFPQVPGNVAYTASVSSKLYTYGTQSVTPTANVTNLNFTPQ